MVVARGGVHVAAAAAIAAAALLFLVQGASAQGWSSFVTKAVFDQKLFKGHIAFYSYEGFKAAATWKSLSAFGSSSNPDDRKRELAAFLAHVHHESGGLTKLREEGVPQDEFYCDTDKPEFRKYPCAPGKRYMGRGPLQLSWNYNYGKCGEFLGLGLLTDPGRVLLYGKTAFKTALWFWMEQGGSDNITAHDAILKRSFAGTIKAINGGIECTENARRTENERQRMLNRVRLYKSFCQMLGVPPGTNLEC